MSKIPTITICEIPFARLTMPQVLRFVRQHLRAPKPVLPRKETTNFWGRTDRTLREHERALFLATPNPEMCLAAQADPEFLQILQNTDLNLPDGTGILWASTFLAQPYRGKFLTRIQRWTSLFWGFVRPSSLRRIFPARVAGSDLFVAMMPTAVELRTKIFLLGARPGVAEACAHNLQHRFPDLQIVGMYAGSPRAEEEKQIRFLINKARPELLFVAYGAPAQEKWIARNLPYLHSVRCAVGVGGTFDFVAGRIRRAPKMWRELGLEWLWRLWKEPTRKARICNAVLVFPRVIEKIKLMQHAGKK